MALLRFWLLLILLTSPLTPVRAQAPASLDEYALKSVFILNFCRFIAWPEGTFSAPNSPMVIGVIGDDPFGRKLDAVVRNETIAGRQLRIERYSSPADIGNPQILFISRDAMGNLDAIFNQLKNRSTVTVGEGEAFLDRGGMVTFTVEKNRIRVSMNRERLRSANLSVSSKLLRVAR